jgi:hypothetical protein
MRSRTTGSADHLDENLRDIFWMLDMRRQAQAKLDKLNAMSGKNKSLDWPGARELFVLVLDDDDLEVLAQRFTAGRVGYATKMERIMKAISLLPEMRALAVDLGGECGTKFVADLPVARDLFARLDESDIEVLVDGLLALPARQLSAVTA